MNLRRNNLAKETVDEQKFFVNSFFFALKFAGKLAQLSVSVLLSSLIYEHLLSHGILQGRNSYFQRMDSILVLLLTVAPSSYRVGIE